MDSEKRYREALAAIAEAHGAEVVAGDLPATSDRSQRFFVAWAGFPTPPGWAGSVAGWLDLYVPIRPIVVETFHGPHLSFASWRSGTSAEFDRELKKRYRDLFGEYVDPMNGRERRIHELASLRGECDREVRSLALRYSRRVDRARRAVALGLVDNHAIDWNHGGPLCSPDGREAMNLLVEGNLSARRAIARVLARALGPAKREKDAVLARSVDEAVLEVVTWAEATRERARGLTENAAAMEYILRSARRGAHQEDPYRGEGDNSHPLGDFTFHRRRIFLHRHLTGVQMVYLMVEVEKCLGADVTGWDESLRVATWQQIFDYRQGMSTLEGTLATVERERDKGQEREIEDREVLDDLALRASREIQHRQINPYGGKEDSG